MRPAEEVVSEIQEISLNVVDGDAVKIVRADRAAVLEEAARVAEAMIRTPNPDGDSVMTHARNSALNLVAFRIRQMAKEKA